MVSTVLIGCLFLCMSDHALPKRQLLAQLLLTGEQLQVNRARRDSTIFTLLSEEVAKSNLLHPIVSGILIFWEVQGEML